MSILARRRAQPKHQEPPDGVLRVASPCPHIEAGESKPLRNAFFNRQGRSSSMTNFQETPGGLGASGEYGHVDSDSSKAVLGSRRFYAGCGKNGITIRCALH